MKHRNSGKAIDQITPDWRKYDHHDGDAVAQIMSVLRKLKVKKTSRQFEV